MVTNHPTINETIEAILTTMQSGRWYPFGELWGPAYKFILNENRTLDEIKLRKCLKRMLDEGLIRVIPEKNVLFDIKTADWNTKVTLEDWGDEIKESGGWINYVNTPAKIPWFKNLDWYYKISTILSIVISIVLAILSSYQQGEIQELRSKGIRDSLRIEQLSAQSDTLYRLLRNQKAAKGDSTLK